MKLKIIPFFGQSNSNKRSRLICHCLVNANLRLMKIRPEFQVRIARYCLKLHRYLHTRPHLWYIDTRLSITPSRFHPECQLEIFNLSERWFCAACLFSMYFIEYAMNLNYELSAWIRKISSIFKWRSQLIRSHVKRYFGAAGPPRAFLYLSEYLSGYNYY